MTSTPDYDTLARIQGAANPNLRELKAALRAVVPEKAQLLCDALDLAFRSGFSEGALAASKHALDQMHEKHEAVTHP